MLFSHQPKEKPTLTRPLDDSRQFIRQQNRKRETKGMVVGCGLCSLRPAVISLIVALTVISRTPSIYHVNILSTRLYLRVLVGHSEVTAVISYSTYHNEPYLSAQTSMKSSETQGHILKYEGRLCRVFGIKKGISEGHCRKQRQGQENRYDIITVAE